MVIFSVSRKIRYCRSFWLRDLNVAAIADHVNVTGDAFMHPDCMLTIGRFSCVNLHMYGPGCPHILGQMSLSPGCELLIVAGVSKD